VLSALVEKKCRKLPNHRNIAWCAAHSQPQFTLFGRFLVLPLSLLLNRLTECLAFESCILGLRA
jgi:hypothetical protein